MHPVWSFWRTPDWLGSPVFRVEFTGNGGLGSPRMTITEEIGWLSHWARTSTCNGHFWLHILPLHHCGTPILDFLFSYQVNPHLSICRTTLLKILVFPPTLPFPTVSNGATLQRKRRLPSLWLWRDGSASAKVIWTEFSCRATPRLQQMPASKYRSYVPVTQERIAVKFRLALRMPMTLCMSLFKVLKFNQVSHNSP